MAHKTTKNKRGGIYLKKGIKKILAMVMSIAMICTTASVSSLAKPIDPNLGITSLNLTEASSAVDKLDTQGWKWSPGTSTLTLKNAKFYATDDNAIQLPDNSTIELAEGTVSTFKLPKHELAAIYCNGKLTVKGKGTLNISGEEASDNECIGINAVDLTIEDTTVNVSKCYSAISSTNFTAQKGSSVIADECREGIQADETAALGGNVKISSKYFAISSQNISSTKDSVLSFKSGQVFDCSGVVSLQGKTTIESGSVLVVDYNQAFVNSGMLTNNGVLLIDEKYKSFKNDGTWLGNKTFYFDGETAPEVAGFTAMMIRYQPIDLTQETEDGNPANVIDKLSTEGWKWDPANGGVLTLNNFYCQYKYAVILPDKAKLVLADNSINTIDKGILKSAALAKSKIQGSITGKGSLTISGNGTLNISNISNAILTEAGNIEITGGNINISNCSGAGIAAMNGNITISGGTIKIDSESPSIAAENNIEISGGNVTATSTYYRAAIMAGNIKTDALPTKVSNIKITGGNVTAKNVCQEDGFGIISLGTIDITGGTVNAETISTQRPAIVAALPVTIGISQLINVKDMDTIPANAVVKITKSGDENDGMFIVSTFTLGEELKITENFSFEACLSKITLTKHVESESSSDSDDSEEPKTITVTETPSSVPSPALIGINASNNAFSQSVEVRLKDDAATKQAIQEAIKASSSALPKDAAVFPLDISLYIKGTDTKVQPMPGETVELTIPVPTELLSDKDKLVVVCITDGKLQVLPTKIVEKNGVYCVEFTASHFSPYALVVDKNNSLKNAAAANINKGNPKTGVTTK